MSVSSQKAIKESSSQILKFPSLPYSLQWKNIVGVAAGYDKNAEKIITLAEQGFAAIEVGTVTPLPQTGQPTAQESLYELQALINQRCFDNKGAYFVAEQLTHLKNLKNKSPQNLYDCRVGVNISCNSDNTLNTRKRLHDFLFMTEMFTPLADYLVLNISSPNAPHLRNLENPQEIESLYSQVQQVRNKLSTPDETPILMKLSPDIAPDVLIYIADTAKHINAEGFIISNTTTARPFKFPPALQKWQNQGGLSGKPLQPLADQTLKIFRQYCAAHIPIIAAGGVFVAADAQQKINLGAQLVQVCTSLYLNPSNISDLVTDITDNTVV